MRTLNERTFAMPQDDGCDIAPHCLECPLPKCKFDDSDFYHGPSWNLEEIERRDDDIRRQHADGDAVEQLSKTFNLSERSIHRIVQAGKNRPGPKRRDTEPPKIDPCELTSNDFKLRDPNVAPFRQGRVTRIFPKACPKCDGDLEANSYFGEVRCLQCALSADLPRRVVA